MLPPSSGLNFEGIGSVMLYIEIASKGVTENKGWMYRRASQHGSMGKFGRKMIL
jgi:hypothetical protein